MLPAFSVNHPKISSAHRTPMIGGSSEAHPNLIARLFDFCIAGHRNRVQGNRLHKNKHILVHCASGWATAILGMREQIWEETWQRTCSLIAFVFIGFNHWIQRLNSIISMDPLECSASNPHKWILSTTLRRVVQEASEDRFQSSWKSELSIPSNQ